LSTGNYPLLTGTLDDGTPSSLRTKEAGLSYRRGSSCIFEAIYRGIKTSNKTLEGFCEGKVLYRDDPFRSEVEKRLGIYSEINPRSKGNCGGKITPVMDEI